MDLAPRWLCVCVCGGGGGYNYTRMFCQQQVWYTWWRSKTFRDVTDFAVHSVPCSQTDMYANNSTDQTSPWNQASSFLSVSVRYISWRSDALQPLSLLLLSPGKKIQNKKIKNSALPVTTATCLSWIPQSSGEVGEMDESRGSGREWEEEWERGGWQVEEKVDGSVGRRRGWTERWDDEETKKIQRKRQREEENEEESQAEKPFIAISVCKWKR